jgi:TM2 domain-containing membrane protein YozV
MKNKIVAALLAFFLGGFGIHKFYLGQTFKGIIYLIFFWTFIPAIIAFFEFIILLVMSDDDFNKRYNTGMFVSAMPATDSGVMKKCPFCAESIKADAIRCKHCASDLIQTTTVQ